MVLIVFMRASVLVVMMSPEICGSLSLVLQQPQPQLLVFCWALTKVELGTKHWHRSHAGLASSSYKRRLTRPRRPARTLGRCSRLRDRAESLLGTCTRTTASAWTRRRLRKSPFCGAVLTALSPSSSVVLTTTACPWPTSQSLGFQGHVSLARRLLCISRERRAAFSKSDT